MILFIGAVGMLTGERQITEVPAAFRLSYEDITILPVMDYAAYIRARWQHRAFRLTPTSFRTIHGAAFCVSELCSTSVTEDGSTGPRGEASGILRATEQYQGLASCYRRTPSE